MRDLADPVTSPGAECPSVWGTYSRWRLDSVHGKLSETNGLPDNSHELVAEDSLVARDLVAGPHCWQGVCTHEVVLVIDWE